MCDVYMCTCVHVGCVHVCACVMCTCVMCDVYMCVYALFVAVVRCMYLIRGFMVCVQVVCMYVCVSNCKQCALAQLSLTIANQLIAEVCAVAPNDIIMHDLYHLFGLKCTYRKWSGGDTT